MQDKVNSIFSKIVTFFLSTILKPFSIFLTKVVTVSDTFSHWYHHKLVEFHDFVELVHVKNDVKMRHKYMCDDELEARIEWAWRRFNDLSPLFMSSDYWPKAKRFMFEKRVKSCLIIPEGKKITARQQRKLNHMNERLDNHFLKETEITRWAEQQILNNK